MAEQFIPGYMAEGADGIKYFTSRDAAAAYNILPMGPVPCMIPVGADIAKAV